MRLSRLSAIACAMILVSGCAGKAPLSEAPEKPEGQAETLLAEGIKNYENGSFTDAATKLWSALDAGLPNTPDKVKAHKYLAFTYCVTEREKLCRDEFAAALKLDPAFELKPAEAGHPIWGGVFRSVKAKSH